MSDISPDQDRRFRMALLEAQAETTLDGLLVVDSDRNVLYHNDRFLDIWEIPESVAAGRSDETLLEYVDSLLADPEEFRERVESLYAHPTKESRDEIQLADGRWFDRYSAPIVATDGTRYGRLWTFRDITDRKERERQLETQRNELAQLQRINTLVREINQALQGTQTRSAIEHAVCSHLTDSDLYQTAWIGTTSQDSTGNRVVVPQASAGVGDDYLDGIPGGEAGPARTALEMEMVQVVTDVASSEVFPAYRREIALEHGHHSVAAVPLVTGDAGYGVLAVYAPSGHTIEDQERDILADLGEAIARAIQRVYSQRALTADVAIDFELAIPDADVAFAAATARLDCKLTVDRRVPAGDGNEIYYLTVHGAGPARACRLLRDVPALAECSVVREAGDTQPGAIEVVLDDESRTPTAVLVGHGASVRTAYAVDGDAHYRAEVPLEVDVRTIVEAIKEGEPTVELVSKRITQRPITTMPEMKDQVRDRLTPKQEAAVEVAYARGYYSWPRASTAEEVASVLDISASTLHYHLRHAHQTMLAALFEDTEEIVIQSERG